MIVEFVSADKCIKYKNVHLPHYLFQKKREENENF